MPSTTPRLAVMICGLVLGLLSSTAWGAEKMISFELIIEPGFPIGAERRWSETLGEMPGVSVRIRSARGGEQPEAEEVDGRLRVTGLLTSQNVLIVPGGSFRSDDVRKLKEWMETLRNEGAENLTAVRAAFGLTDTQLNEVHEVLQRPITFSTKNIATAEFLERLAGELTIPVERSSALERRLGDPMLDELNGISIGTALAAALRPCGLVFVPQRVQGQTVLMVIEGKTAEEFWPVGWSVDKPLRAAMPNLFKFVSVGITDTPLDEAIDAVQQRLDAPMLWDHNAMAREGIDPRQVKVTVPADRTYYKRILDRMLIQAKMRCEIRVDEAGTAFVWLTSGRDK